MRFRDMPKLTLVLIVLMFVVGAVVYPKLPARIPMHWGPTGAIDGWGTKSLATVFFAPLLAAVLYVVLWFAPYLDPKRGNVVRSGKVYAIAVDGLGLMMTVVFLGQLYASFHTGLPMATIVEVATGLLFMVLGNFIGRVKRNFTMGFRYSWTLVDDVVWAKTNRLGGALMVAAGALAILGAAFGPFVGVAALLIPSLAMVPITYVYAMRLYRERHPDDLEPPIAVQRAEEDAALLAATTRLADPREPRIEVACPHCGAENAPGNERCIVCGRPLER